MNDQQIQKTGLTPRLRFPEFREKGEWVAHPLRDDAAIITERVEGRSFTPMSVTSGVGLVTQEEKFGRTIAGEQYKNYIVIERDDFAYNKSSTKEYPQGFIARYLGNEPASVPNSIFTCFRVQKDKLNPDYLNYLFTSNLHGKWLRQYLTVGARAHGSLNIDDDDLLSLQIPRPGNDVLLAEQHKVAACLSSLDALVAAEAGKLTFLKKHKKSLMQQFLPDAGETQPKLRFDEFRDAGDWKEKTLGDIATIRSGTTPSRSESKYYENGTIPWVKTTDLTNSFILHTEECITPDAKARINPIHSVLVAMYGGFNQIGRTGYLTMPAATNQAISVLNINSQEIIPIYLLMWLNGKIDYWRRIASSSRKDPNITGADVAKFPILYPLVDEQRKIADCLSSIEKLIGAQIRKLQALQAHKKGLMQQLFPVMDEVEG